MPLKYHYCAYSNGTRLEDKKSSLPSSSKAARSSRTLILALVTLAQFMVIIDFTIVQVALPSIGKEFGVSINGLQWIVVAYGLTLAGFLMLSGRSGDLYGHKKLFIIGVMLFSLSSLVGGLAPSENVLIIARAIQGLGAAMASATGLSILAATFPEGQERNRALSIFAAATGSGFAAGMIAGGIITAMWGWRWVFDINVPIGIVIASLSTKYISLRTALPNPENRHLDILGAVSVTAGLMLLVYALSAAESTGIGSFETLGLFISSAIVLAAFILIEYRSNAPLIPLGFVRKRTIFGANALALLQIAPYVAMVFILTNYLQQVLGYSALATGLAFVPMGVVFLVISGFLSARLINYFGIRPNIILGMALQTIGYLLLTRISSAGSYLGGLLGPMLIIGLGTGLAFTAINIAALTGTRKGEEGLASGLVNTSRQIGGPLGLALLLTVANIETPTQPAYTLQQSAMTMIGGFSYAFWVAALLAGMGIVFAASLKQKERGGRTGVASVGIHST